MVNTENLRTTLINLRNEGYKMLLGIFCSDISNDDGQNFELMYALFNPAMGSKTCVRVCSNSTMPSVCDIFKSACFDEREIFDLFGVTFEGHPNLKRLLLPDSWMGHPLRKDYVQEDVRLTWRK